MAPSLHFLITAGPTREAIDPVRFISNRSSGKMGFAVAQAAAEAGHRVTLVAGPVALATPAGVDRRDVVSAAEMATAVSDLRAGIDVAIFTAAVADFRPVQVQPRKIKKEGRGPLVLTLERTPDILGSMRSPGGYRGILVGFAAETDNLLANAHDKLHHKGCDLMVANDVSRSGVGFDADVNETTLLFAGGEVRELPRMSKLEIGRELVRVAVGLHLRGVPGRPAAPS